MVTVSAEPRAAVVTPVYKLELNRYEYISLQRHLSILRRYNRYLLIPSSLRHGIEAQLLPSLKDSNSIQLHVVGDHWLTSQRSYNQLMLSSCFYRHYHEYSHLLVAQLDAYTFADHLEAWCKSQWDYIGAPIYQLGSCWEDSFLCTGSGGFSLRDVQCFLRVLNHNPVIYTWADLRERLRAFNTKGKLVQFARFLPCWLTRVNRLREDTNKLAHWAGVNEDVCFAKYLPTVDPTFKVAGYEDSVAFCIDGHVQLQLQHLNGQLPFGTHAWWTRPEDLQAWTPFIEELHR